MATLEDAIDELRQALNDSRIAQNWRWLVRQKLSAVKDALAAEQVRYFDGWLAAKASVSDRDRTQLLARIGALGPRVLERLDTERARTELGRLVEDLEHFRQRLHDLAYDSVSMEIGGSE
jgi:hypothetical protein